MALTVPTVLRVKIYSEQICMQKTKPAVEAYVTKKLTDAGFDLSKPVETVEHQTDNADGYIEFSQKRYGVFDNAFTASPVEGRVISPTGRLMPPTEPTPAKMPRPKRHIERVD